MHTQPHSSGCFNGHGGRKHVQYNVSASRALKFTIEQAFSNGAECVWVDPNPENKKALELYRRIGMIEKEVPEAIRDPEFSQVYFELRK